MLWYNYQGEKKTKHSLKEPKYSVSIKIQFIYMFHAYIMSTNVHECVIAVDVFSLISKDAIRNTVLFLYEWKRRTIENID